MRPKEKCRPVGLPKPNSHPSKRSKSLFKLSVPKEHAAKVLQELKSNVSIPISRKRPAPIVKEGIADDASLSSFSPSERLFLNIESPKANKSSKLELPEESRKDFVLKWSSAQTPPPNGMSEATTLHHGTSSQRLSSPPNGTSEATTPHPGTSSQRLSSPPNGTSEATTPHSGTSSQRLSSALSAAKVNFSSNQKDENSLSEYATSPDPAPSVKLKSTKRKLEFTSGSKNSVVQQSHTSNPTRKGNVGDSQYNFEVPGNVSKPNSQNDKLNVTLPNEDLSAELGSVDSTGSSKSAPLSSGKTRKLTTSKKDSPNLSPSKGKNFTAPKQKGEEKKHQKGSSSLERSNSMVHQNHKSNSNGKGNVGASQYNFEVPNNASKPNGRNDKLNVTSSSEDSSVELDDVDLDGVDLAPKVKSPPVTNKGNQVLDSAGSSMKTTLSLGNKVENAHSVKPKDTSELSPYQLARLKNLQENEKLLSDVLKGHGSPSNSKDHNSSHGLNSKVPRPKPQSSRKKLTKQGKSPTPSIKERTMPQRSCSKVARLNLRDDPLSGEEGDSSGHDDNPDGEESCTSSHSSVFDAESENGSDVESDSSSHCSEHQRTRRWKGGNRQSQEDYENFQHTMSQVLDNPDEEALSLSEEEDTSDDSPPQTAPNAKPKTKKQIKAENKVLRDSGKQYTGVTGKVVRARGWKPPHKCGRNKCHEVITPEVGALIFKDYWAQGSYNKRLSYVTARMEKSEVSRKRPRVHELKREKQVSFKYFFYINGARIQVCRATFLNTLDETDRFVRDAAKNKDRSFSGISSDDSRGRKTPKHAFSPATKEAILRHIESFPAYVSHYCRAQTNQLYLSPELNVKKMHELYCLDNPKVSYDSYRRIFNTTKRKFHAPKSDGCDTCDKLEVKIEAAEGEEKVKLKAVKELHLRKAEQGYELKRVAKQNASKDDTKRTIIFDLQQCLPTPHLKCKRIYYSRQLYVYNFTISDSKTGRTHCHMWSEVEGKRGSNEMASCLYNHIMNEIPEGVTHLSLFSDCCSGQNRNATMTMMLFVALQDHPSLQKIDHIFLVPGHTFMPEVDSKHATIEKYKKNLTKVSVPSEWYDVVTQAGMTDKKHFPDGKFKVVHMTTFLDFASMAKNQLVRRNKCVDKQPFGFMETQWMSYDKANLGLVNVKTALTEVAPFKTVSFLRRGVRSDRLPKMTPPTIPPRSVPISVKKKEDLLELLPYLEEVHHRFYQEIQSCSSVRDTHPGERPPQCPEDDVET